MCYILKIIYLFLLLCVISVKTQDNNNLKYDWFYSTIDTTTEIISDQDIIQTSLEKNTDSCGIIDNQFNTDVIENKTISHGSWPWLTAIYASNEQQSSLSFLCSGNLISEKVVLTVAHCLKSIEKTYQAHEIIVYLGRINIKKWIPEEGSEVKESSIVFSHPDYMKSTSFDADIAVIVFKTRVIYNKFIRPICLWNDSIDIKLIEDRFGTIVGWGRDNTGQTLKSEPKIIHVPIVSNKMCLNSGETFRQITSNRTFCAGKRDGTGPCYGDSGSGLAIQWNGKWTLRGLVSVAKLDPLSEVCNLQEYIVYTDIAQFLTWIQYFITYWN